MAANWQALLTDAEQAVLFSADVDRIQEYVFESARLPEIRGASMRIQELLADDNPIVRQWLPWIIYQGGGSLLALLPDVDRAERFKQQLQAHALAQTGLVTITCVLHPTPVARLKQGYLAPVTPQALWALRSAQHQQAWKRLTAAYGLEPFVDEVAFKTAVEQQLQTGSHFGQMVKLMGLLLQRAKDQRPPPPFYETMPHAQRCRSCGQRPAGQVGSYNDVVDQRWPFCDPCWRKVQDRQDRRQTGLDRAQANLSPTYFNALTASQVKAPNDLTDIGQACQTRSGYLAFIYVDGDAIGRFMHGQATAEAYYKASQALKDATEEAIYGAIDHHLRPVSVTRKKMETPDGGEETVVDIHPFEIVAIGGDDGLLFAPADMALPLAAGICRRFSRAIQEKLGQTLTMSAGVVIASAHTPVRALRDIARQLLKSAKRQAKASRDAGQPSGGLDFLVLTSQSMLRRNLDDLRNTYPLRLPGESKAAALRLTAAPYSLPHTEILLGLLGHMRRQQFPASQLQQLATALREGRERGSLYFLYQQARLQNRPQGQVLQQIIDVWPFKPKQDPIPWQEAGPADDQAQYISILPDLADLYSFVPTDPDTLARWPPE